ncbi:serine hydrolase [Marinobacter nanhaiticus D15-8W]|uniref:Serine hydrolase n=1 Tax=Marinobacter nanhaiticus D15-8W TaxID=626887 RepID=N6W500_9GAMM|nr:serine hydrolase [Marinobacter nanhaiticus]ENO15234.1 serine hydrolase [Marinobacter nanhaiticus D15-8W]
MTRRLLLLAGSLLSVLLYQSGLAQAQAVSAPIDKLNVSQATRAAADLDRLHSVLVAVEGDVVYAQVFSGPGLDEPVNIKSLSKTVHSIIIGAAIDRGIIDSADQPITELVAVPQDASPRVAEVTVGNLLSMQAGLGRTSGPNYGEWVTSDNWVDYALSRPFVAEPGGEMLYSTGSYHILAAALTETTGRSLLALAREWLGQPLDIRIPPWQQDPQGIYFGGNNMQLSPLALLQIGELYRNRGQHEGEQVISEAWIETAWEPRGTSRYTSDRYGYGWFTTELAGYDTYYGRGYGGQMLYVIPALKMTAVMTADPTPPSSPYFMRKLDGLLVDYLIPSIQKMALK